MQKIYTPATKRSDKKVNILHWFKPKDNCGYQIWTKYLGLKQLFYKVIEGTHLGREVFSHAGFLDERPPRFFQSSSVVRQ